MFNKASIAVTVAAVVALASSPLAARSSIHGGHLDMMGGSHPSTIGTGAPGGHGSMPPGPVTTGSGTNMAVGHGPMPPAPSTGGGMHHHHHFDDDDDFFFFGSPFFPYPDPYFVYVRTPESQSPSNQYWYYCPNSKSYYPWVKTCEGAWEPVPASPPPPPPAN